MGQHGTAVNVVRIDNRISPSNILL